MKIRALILIIGTWLVTGCTATFTENPDPVEQKISSLLSEMTSVDFRWKIQRSTGSR